MKRTETRQQAEVVALNALGFLAREPERIGRFLALSGTAPEALPGLIRDPAFLGGVLDHLLQDETTLFLFAAEEDIAPERIATMRMTLPGGGAP